MNNLKQIFILFFFFAISNTLNGHNLNYEKVNLHEWTVNQSIKIKASFLMLKDEEVYLQKDNSETVHFPLADFASTDQQFVLQRYNNLRKLNSQHNSYNTHNNFSISTFSFNKILIVASVLLITYFLIYFSAYKNKLKYIFYLLAVTFLTGLYGFQITSILQSFSSTNPLSVDSAFTPFKPNVVTSWDSNYFYVESQGITTTHGMMTGIIKWQQQVPIPQCYIKPNAWMIPLNPIVATSPVPVDSIHFTRGAIAIAINGIPIFNYHTNTGVDAYLDGQLDQWGGHCGRADDYHYHIAPLQLYNNTPNTMPIAFALDGFAVYGSYEPDGSVMLPLDTNNGHYGSNGVYHYHGIVSAPYMIGKMVGQVTEDATHQIIPQPHAQPVRPALTPLNGAIINNCIPNPTNNGYTLVYLINGYTDSVVYSWTNSGIYSFNFYTNGILDSLRNYNGFTPCLLPTSTYKMNSSTEQIQIFPNPSHNEFSLKLNNFNIQSEIENIIMLSSKGEIVFSSNYFQERFKTENLRRGIYFIIIKTTNSTVTKKLVLQ
jgi:hypothetical protein